MRLQLLAGHVAALAEPVADVPHRTLGTGLRTADAGELRLVLHAPPLVEDLAVRLERDAVRAQEVGLRRAGMPAASPRLSTPIFRHARRTTWRSDSCHGTPLEYELVDPEVLERNGDDPVQSFDPGDLERAHEDVAGAVLLRVDERVRNGHGNLVAELRGANRVAVDEQVGHGP